MSNEKQTISLKLVLKTSRPREIRRIRVSEYEELMENVKKFTGIEDFEGLIFQYLDEDGDWITFDSKMEFEEIRQVKTSPVRLRVFPRRNRSFRCRRRFGRRQQQQNQGQFPQFMQNWAEGWRKRCQGGGRRCGMFGRPRGMFRGGRGGMMRRCRPWLKKFMSHKNIICDGCEKKNWVGRRFKCQNCDDYDLCGRCYHRNRKVHDLTHEFKEMQMTFEFPNLCQPTSPPQPQPQKTEEKNEEMPPPLVTEEEEEENRDLPPVSMPELEEEEEESHEQPKEESILYPEIYDDDVEEEQEQPPQEMSESKIEVPEVPLVSTLDKKEEEETEEKEYSKEIGFLNEMGFKDESINLFLLNEHNGDVQKVVSLLIRM